MLELRLLGPVELRAGDLVLDPQARPQQQLTLAALAVDAGRLVPVESLVDRIWGIEPPAQTSRTLYTHISRIRKLLHHAAAATEAPARLSRRTGGYLLEIEPEMVDLHRFRYLIERARGRPGREQADLLRAALDLWRGEPLAGLAGEWCARMRANWRQQRLEAVVAWAETKVECDDPADVISQLAPLCDENPLAEPLASVLIRALHRAGRRAEALDHYAVVCQRLADELGVDPSQRLREAHVSILRDAAEKVAVQAPSPSGPVPAQLPRAIPGFVGRASEIAELHRILAGAGQRPDTVVISVITGTAGVGKTALALRWAHNVRDQFPDGQLFVNLRGFGRNRSAMSPADAVRDFLSALGVAPQQIPPGFEAQVGLYRTMLAQRRILVVLDNARDAEQVRPLLPGTAGCLVLVTSRNQMAGLVAVDCAQPLKVDLLSEHEAREMLRHRIGPDRTDLEPTAADEIVVRCARLPLALAIVAARAAVQPRLRMRTLAAHLRASRDSLDAFANGDASASARHVFSWSYRMLTAPAGRLFRLLGLHPGPDIGVFGVAGLCGTPVNEVEGLLTELIEAHLIEEPMPGRYAFHDLLRAFAAELASADDAECSSARHRMLDHYAHTARAGAKLLAPDRHLAVMPACRPDAAAEPLADPQRASQWFERERPALLSLVERAGEAGFASHAARLAAACEEYLDGQGRWRDQERIQRVALAVAAEPSDRAHAHRCLALVNIRFGRLDEAHHHLTTALDVYNRLGDRTGQAGTHHSLGCLMVERARFREALRHFKISLSLFHDEGVRAGAAHALNSLAWSYVHLGEKAKALAAAEDAVAEHSALGNSRGEASASDTLGRVKHLAGRPAEAIHHYETALRLYRELGTRRGQFAVLGHLGDARHDMGDYHTAASCWREAMQIAKQLGHPDTEKMRNRLDQLKTAPHNRTRAKQ